VLAPGCWTYPNTPDCGTENVTGDLRAAPHTDRAALLRPMARPRQRALYAARLLVLMFTTMLPLALPNVLARDAALGWAR
jgi:hypothetical protein